MDFGGAAISAADCLRRTLRHNGSGNEDGDAVGEPLGLVHRMRGDDDRRAELPEPLDHAPCGPASRRIEAGGRLVEKEQLGVADQRESDVETPALPAREVLRECVDAIGQPDQLGDLGGSARRAVVAGIELQAFAHGQPAIGLGLLKDDADALSPGAVGGRRVDPEHAGGATAAGAKPGQDFDEGRLARPVGAQQSEDFATPNLRIDAPEHVMRPIAPPKSPRGNHNVCLRLAHASASSGHLLPALWPSSRRAPPPRPIRASARVRT